VVEVIIPDHATARGVEVDVEVEVDVVVINCNTFI